MDIALYALISYITGYYLTFPKKSFLSNFLAYSFMVTSYLDSSTSSPVTCTNPQDLSATPYKGYINTAVYVLHRNLLQIQNT